MVASANEVAEILARTVDATAAVERVAAHLRRHWQGAMCERLRAHAAAGGKGLNELALRASLRL